MDECLQQPGASSLQRRNTITNSNIEGSIRYNLSWNGFVSDREQNPLASEQVLDGSAPRPQLQTTDFCPPLPYYCPLDFLVGTLLLQVSPRALFLFQKDTCSTPRWVGLIQSQLYKGCYLPGLSAGNFIIYLKLQIYVYIYILIYVCRYMFLL